MSKLKVSAFSISVDGFAAGPEQSLENPLGLGGMAVHQWFRGTRTFSRMFGGDEGSPGIDDDFAARSIANLGAWILGRNMFTPERGPWTSNDWKGWWGPNPPYHTPVFILTHHPRASIEMEGGTTFHFVTGGVQAALTQARQAAGSRDVRIGGGAATIRQYLQAGLVDEMHLAISPTLLGRGEPLLAGIDMAALGFQCTEHAASAKALHVVLTKPNR